MSKEFNHVYQSIIFAKEKLGLIIKIMKSTCGVMFYCDSCFIFRKLHQSVYLRKCIRITKIRRWSHVELTFPSNHAVVGWKVTKERTPQKFSVLLFCQDRGTYVAEDTKTTTTKLFISSYYVYIKIMRAAPTQSGSGPMYTNVQCTLFGITYNTILPRRPNDTHDTFKGRCLMVCFVVRTIVSVGYYRPIHLTKDSREWAITIK